MNRKEIKELAKSKINGNLWKLLWPSIAIGIAYSVLMSVISPSTMTTTMLEYTEESMPKISPIQGILIIAITILFGVASVAYKKYILNFARNGKCEFSDIIECIKTKWASILVASVVSGVLVFLASLLFVIPGIILGLAYQMVGFILVDTETDGIASLKESRRIMNGYKMDYFIFSLSFIGWGFLAGLTFGILLIWLLPYIMVADALYYDKLKKIQKAK